MRNTEHRLYECSFGPIGRTGGRGVKPGFGPRMRDFDNRELEVRALYHQQYGSPNLVPNTGPTYWNFLEMNFDPRGADPNFNLKIRNLIDPPTETSRGGGAIEDRATNTGRLISSALPKLKTLPDADVLFTTSNGAPVRGTRSLPDGTLPMRGFVDVAPGTRLIMTTFDREKANAQVIKTLPPTQQAVT